MWDVERGLLNGQADKLLDGCHCVMVVTLAQLSGHVALQYGVAVSGEGRGLGLVSHDHLGVTRTGVISIGDAIPPASTP